jgi:hypothetical protein
VWRWGLRSSYSIRRWQWRSVSFMTVTCSDVNVESKGLFLPTALSFQLWNNSNISPFQIEHKQQFPSLGGKWSLNPSTPELNPSAQRCLTRYFTGDFVSWTVNFVNIFAKSQQIHKLFIQVINYVWWLLHVPTLHCHLQGAFPVPSERCSVEE